MAANSIQTEQTIIDYIAANTLYDIHKINSQTMLFKEGIFDSMGFILLIDFLEENFGIKTSDADLIEENFESISAITRFIERKRTAKAA
jgi:acyl carrier protein